jgi:hypothetical protein
MSLLYECIHAVIVGNMLADNEALANVCVNKLASFLTDIDQNRELPFSSRGLN